MRPTFLPPPVVALVAAAGMYATAHPAPAAPVGLRIAGLACAGAGLLLMAAAAVTMIRQRTTLDPTRPERARSLVTRGVFARSRNPIYLADALMLLGWALWLGQPGALLWLVGFVAWIDRVQIAAEEAALERLFGEAYRAYCARVRRWF
ncbi:MAG TPA: isoprenylcysteine carboxylmethyltransferase family protein [Burkholderiaceae bacterium]|nr:isoprenylcysteine carboxylmethyltransferase family protein [Burkholderiaceae bacterium]